MSRPPPPPPGRSPTRCPKIDFALEGLASNGLIARTATDTMTVRTLAAPAAGIAVSNGDGVAGNPTLALANDLAALEALSGTSTIYYRSGVDTWSAVTIGANLGFSAGTLGSSLGTAATLAFDTDATFAANSDAKIATQKAVKTYVDQIISAQDAMVFKGIIDCSANPNYPAADRGHSYRVSVAGKIGGASGANVEIGDLLLCLTDGTAAGTQAGVGANWGIIQTNLDGAVIGPASATDGGFARFDGATGKLIKNSAATVSISTEVSGLGTGVATALAVNVGSAGAFVTFNGAAGTPSSLTLTNATGLPIAGLTASTATAIGVGSIELGHASDTTIARSGAGDITIEGNAVYRAGGTDVAVADGGTGRSTSTTPYGLIAAGTTATGAHQTIAAGATTDILVGGGASALPAWTTATGSGAPVRATSPTIATPTITGLVDNQGGQIKFPATQVPSADVNTLDDYEEGTFTPSLVFGVGSTGMTYSSQLGKYTKVGRQVTIEIKIVLTAKGSSTGPATITGLPFGTGAAPNAAGAFMGGNLVTVAMPCFLLSASSGNISLFDFTGSTWVSLSDTDFGNTSEIYLGTTYAT
jgi:hypothetical protein